MNTSFDPPDVSVRVFGSWWIPGSEQHRSGLLTFSPHRGGTLELDGSLSSFAAATPDQPVQFTAEAIEAAGNYGRIIGIATGRAYTLDGCFQTRHSGFPLDEPGRAAETIHVAAITEDVHFEADEALVVNQIEAQLLHLPTWIGGSIRESWTIPRSVGAAPSGVTIEGYPTFDEAVDIEGGMSLRVRERYSVEGDRVTERNLRRNAIIVITGSVDDLDTFLGPLQMLGDLVSIGTGRTSTVESLHLFNPDCIHELGDRDPISMPLRRHVAWSNWERRDPAPIEPHRLLFTATDMGGIEAIGRWCSLARHRAILGRVMATRYRPGFPSDQLLNCAAALEALDKAYHSKKLKFDARMRRILRDVGPSFGQVLGDPERWVEAITIARHHAAHHTDREDPSRGPRDYALAQTAYYLFVTRFLQLAEASEEAMNKVASGGLRGWASRI